MQSEKRKIKVQRSKYFNFLAFIFSFAIFAFSFLPAAAINESLGSQYEFHLYFDNGQLVADRDYQFKYDIIAVPYEEPAQTVGFPYRGEIINFVGSIAANFKFDPRGGNPNFTAGKILVRAPYVPDGQRAVFYDPQGNAVLTISVSESSYCNDDGFCNADRGEDFQSCPIDCKTSALPAAPAEQNNQTPTQRNTGQTIVSLLFIIVGIGALGGLWWFFRKRGQKDTFTPPSGPTFPTPPTPPNPGNNL